MLKGKNGSKAIARLAVICRENVPANEFLNLEGDKISTSRNWAVWLNEYLVDMPGKQDVLRYVLTANAPETKDNDFTWKDYQARNNNELVAILGNFVNRALVLTGKYFEGKVPAAGELTDYDRQTLQDFADVKANVERLLDTYHFRDAQKEAMNLARIGNKYLADTEPWKLAKTDMDRVATIMNIYAETKKDIVEQKDMQRRLLPILHKYNNVSMYVCGHIHNFQHIRKNGDTIDYVVNSAGSLSRKVKPTDGTVFCSPSTGFSVISATKESLSLYMIDNHGVAIHQVKID